MNTPLLFDLADQADSGRSTAAPAAGMHRSPLSIPHSLGLIPWAMVVLFALFLSCTIAHAQVFWRVSVKVFTDSNGNRPSGRTDTQIQADYENYNQLIAAYARGCRLQLTEIVQLPSNLSSWYNVVARDGGNRDALLTAATANPATYAYRSTAINIYINNSGSGVCCGANNGLIFVGNEDGAITMFHEAGHMLGLAHTQGAGCNSCCPDPLGCCDSPGDDGVNDTILDLPCWSSQNVIAQNNFGANYANLTATRQNQVDDVWFNIMSYHGNRTRLTPGQMDKVAEVSNSSRDNVTGNYFRFVDGVNGNDGDDGLSIADSFKTITAAISGSGNDDVLLVRSGTYNKATSGSWVINANRVLCSRKGTVRLTRQ
jgi:hypothetical protein